MANCSQCLQPIIATVHPNLHNCIEHTVAVKKTVMFSFHSVPLEQKRNARSIGRKRYVPFPKTVIERWAAPLERNYRSMRMQHATTVFIRIEAAPRLVAALE